MSASRNLRNIFLTYGKYCTINQRFELSTCYYDEKTSSAKTFDGRLLTKDEIRDIVEAFK